MSRAITNLNQEQKRIVKLSSSLTPIDVWSDEAEEMMGRTYDDFFTSIEDDYCYNSSYYYGTRPPAWRQYQYGVTIEKCKKYVVLRYVVYDVTFGGYNAISERSGEVMQRWITQDGKEYVMARPLYNEKYQYWRIKAPMRMVKDAKVYRDVNGSIYGIRLPKRIGQMYKYNLYRYFTNRIDDYTPVDLAKNIFALSPLGETLNKCHHKLFTSLALRKDYLLVRILKHERQFRIALRGHFQFTHKNIDTWLDYVRMLQNNLPNAAYQRAYLCPQDIKHAHDWIAQIDNKRRAREEMKVKSEKAKAALQDFLNHHAELMNINIGDRKIELHSLNSPMEYVKEGAAMHHCVGRYYEEPNSLIFSARDTKTGKRIATIEVNVKTQGIVQVRGVCNKSVKEDKEIRQIIETNMPIIKERITKQNKRKEVA